jgi:hypothetical protein
MLFVARSFLVSLFFIRSNGSGSWKKDWYEECAGDEVLAR